LIGKVDLIVEDKIFVWKLNRGNTEILKLVLEYDQKIVILREKIK